MNLSAPEKRDGNESVREPGKSLFVPAVEGVLNGRNVIILPLFLQFFADFSSFLLRLLPIVSLSVTRINYCSSIV